MNDYSRFYEESRSSDNSHFWTLADDWQHPNEV
jgi:hypothetical protein